MLVRKLFGAVFGLALVLSLSVAARAEEVLVFAAASTTNAINDIGALFAAKGLGTIKASFGSSSTLAKQIEQGAPAGVFLSADLKWMDYLVEHKSIVLDSRRNLLGNALVLIAPSDSKQGSISIDKSTNLVALLGDGRLATGDPDHVPVGIYAKQTLVNMGQWAALEPHIARADSVRAGLALVERGESPLGIVYSTDAAVTKKVKVVGTFPDSLHDTILYPVALVAGHDTPAAKAFLDFLSTPEAKAVFVHYGFKLN
jgi:molybdate transport system substrate-binding protein